MNHKALLKRIIRIIEWITVIVMIGFGMVHFFIRKDLLKGMQWLIMWSGIGIINAGALVNIVYLDKNFSWKRNWENILVMIIAVLIIVAEIKILWV